MRSYCEKATNFEIKVGFPLQTAKGEYSKILINYHLKSDYCNEQVISGNVVSCII